MNGPPVSRRLPSDLPHHPDALFERLKQRSGAFWLDSGSHLSRHGRYHHLGAGPDNVLTERDGLPWDHLAGTEHAAPDHRQTDWPAPRWVGYFAYDLGRTLECVPDVPASLDSPESYLARYPAVVTIDSATGHARITGDSDAAVDRLLDWLRTPSPATSPSLELERPPESTWSQQRFTEAIARAHEYIAAGDVYQVNLSHRFEAVLRHAEPGTSAEMYLRMRRAHSAPYGAFLSLVGQPTAIDIVSNSPEGFLDVDLRPDRARVVTWPLKGTRPASGDEGELRASVKDRAEHVMIVDLERNDLGRIAIPGTVRVPALMDVVHLPTVLHLESRVEATPRAGVSLVDVFSACFPGGSITGAPKVRSMEIIAELESERRGVYCGAFGYVDVDGRRSKWSIPIRTAVIEGRRISFRSGSGIVHDSVAEAEWQETLDKAVALLRAIQPYQGV